MTAKIKEKQMSEPHNDIGFPERKSPLSMKQILAERNSFTYPEHIKTDGVVAVTNSRELLVQYPEVKTESDVDIAADILVKVFNAPKSRGFYCDCARHLDRSFITQAVYNATRVRTNRPITNPPAYFGRICTKMLVKLGVYK